MYLNCPLLTWRDSISIPISSSFGKPWRGRQSYKTIYYWKGGMSCEAVEGSNPFRRMGRRWQLFSGHNQAIEKTSFLFFKKTRKSTPFKDKIQFHLFSLFLSFCPLLKFYNETFPLVNSEKRSEDWKGVLATFARYFLTQYTKTGEKYTKLP
jgi:hypothetical protein